MIRDLHFPNSAIVKAPENLILRDGRKSWIELPVRYGVFTHERAGRCLIDTGYSARVTRGTRSLPLRLYEAILRPRLTEHALPDAQGSVDTILVTHLHADHVAALRDYPLARIFADRDAILHFLESDLQGLPHGVFRELLPDDLLDRLVDFAGLPVVEAPLSLGKGFDVFGDGSVLAIPLPGHMRGHTGFCFPQQDPPLLYAGDAQWLSQAVMEDRLPGAPASWILDDEHDCHQSAARIRAFSRAGGQVVYCHDPEAPEGVS